MAQGVRSAVRFAPPRLCLSRCRVSGGWGLYTACPLGAHHKEGKGRGEREDSERRGPGEDFQTKEGRWSPTRGGADTRPHRESGRDSDWRGQAHLSAGLGWAPNSAGDGLLEDPLPARSSP